MNTLARGLLLSVVVLRGMALVPCFAQIRSTERTLPDAPSAVRVSEQSVPDRTDVKKESTLDILMRRSVVFPDLATSREPLSSGEKFKLSVSNTLSPFSIGGSLLGAGISQAMDSYPDYGQGAEGFGSGSDLRWEGPHPVSFLEHSSSPRCCIKILDISRSKTQR